VLHEQSNEAIAGFSLVRKLQTLTEAYWSTQTVRALDREIAQVRPDVAIVQNVFPLISPSVYATLHRHRVPIVQAVYNYRLICPAAELYSRGEICERCVAGNHVHAVIRSCYRDSRLASAWYASIIALHRRLGTFARYIDAFMVPDHFLAQKLVEGGLPAAKMHRNANPIFLPDRPGPASHAGYVLYVGRLVRPKGVLTAIAAMKHVRSDTRLVLVGGGELEAEVRERIEAPELNARISFLGRKWGDELRGLMAGALAVLIPSEWYDNLPQVLCQANAAGKPVIASRINGIPEYVVPGLSGFLFTPGHARELASAIDRAAVLSADEYATLCRTSREHAEATFDYEVHHERLMGLIESLVEPERACANSSRPTATRTS
jgi:glycosyltransferase involved in cell wall biosynthesis